MSSEVQEATQGFQGQSGMFEGGGRRKRNQESRHPSRGIKSNIVVCCGSGLNLQPPTLEATLPKSLLPSAAVGILGVNALIAYCII